MSDDHKKDVDEFKEASNNLVDPDLKSFANNALPTLQSHLDSAKAIQEMLKKQMKISNRPPVK